jgi:hypothetical protein
MDTEIVWVERELVHGAIGRMTGASDVKNQPGAWMKWWKDKGAEWEKTALAAK